jgi:hypothetical protein
LSTGKNITKFGKLLTEKTKALIDVQTHWCIVESVDWTEKTMIATGLTDDLDFHDVNLGIGAIHTKPSLKSKCLIGIINNNPADAFLIESEQIDEIEIIDKSGFKIHLNNGKMTINGNKFGGLVDAKELKKQVDKNTLILKQIQSVFQSWVPVPNDGGASLKALVTGFIAMQTADLSNIENKNIQHG